MSSMLKRSDLKKEARPIDLVEKEVEGIKVLHHNVFSNGIHYLNLVFDVETCCAGGLAVSVSYEPHVRTGRYEKLQLC